MKVSLRNLNILLALACIVITAVVCMVMSITSADDALADTNTLVESTADQCFGTGDASLRAALEDYLTSVQEGASQIIVNFLSVHRVRTQKLAAEMGSFPPEVTESWAFMDEKSSSVINELRMFNGMGATAVSLIGHKGQGVTMFEDFRTISNPVGGYHHYMADRNNGSDYDAEAGAPTAIRTIIGTADPYTGQFLAPENSTYRSTDGLQMGCTHDGRAFETNGAQPSPRCVTWKYDQKDVYSLTDFLQVHGEAGVRWSPLFPIPPYIVILMMGTWSHETANGVRLGAVMNGLDVRAISRELGRLKLGKGGTTSKGRLYTSVNSDWMYDVSGIPDFNQKYILTAVSHGEYVFLFLFRFILQRSSKKRYFLECSLFSSHQKQGSHLSK